MLERKQGPRWLSPQNQLLPRVNWEGGEARCVAFPHPTRWRASTSPGGRGDKN